MDVHGLGGGAHKHEGAGPEGLSLRKACGYCVVSTTNVFIRYDGKNRIIR